MVDFKRVISVFMVGMMAVTATAVPAQANGVGTEENVGGAIVVFDDYFDKLTDPSGFDESVSGEAVSVSGTAAEYMAELEEEAEDVEDDNSGSVSGPATSIRSAVQAGEHVKLNLNYSRLGIANKVSNYLNVRNKPSTNARIVGKMTKNSGCHIYSIKKGWAKIVSGEVNGYVKSEYLTTDKEAEELALSVGRDCVEIQTDSLNVRALPTVTAPIYSVVDKGEEFVIKKENVDREFIDKVIAKQKLSENDIQRAGGMEAIEAHMDEFIGVYVDDDYAFVSKEYVTEQYSLKRAVKVKTVHASKESGVSAGQASIVEYAKQFLGNPYVWGGTSLTHGCDCSGFVMSLYAHYGHGLPHSSAAQAGCTRSVSSPKPGDLFFYGSGGVSHVAMYIGGGQVIHASNHRDGIKISNAYYRHPLKIGRVM